MLSRHKCSHGLSAHALVVPPGETEEEKCHDMCVMKVTERERGGGRGGGGGSDGGREGGGREGVEVREGERDGGGREDYGS